MQRLKGRVALVTGGQRGLGAAIVREFVREGANCFVNYPPGEEGVAAEFSAGMAALGNHVNTVEADITSEPALGKLVQTILASAGRIDILVNNAGVNPLKTWDELDWETWNRTIEVNLTGVFNCCKAVLPIMKEKKAGNIINIASVAAFIGRGNADYIASKSALLGLTRSLARQMGRFGIRANAISPGFHNTGMTQQARHAAENADEFISQVPLGYLAEPDSIGKAALFLASDESAYITGHNLVVDGGLTLR